ncbi:MAG: acyl-CoA dehydrogenase, partial [Rhodovibrionaceae bacterium]
MSPAEPAEKLQNRTVEQRAQFKWEDPFLLDRQLTEEERMVRDAAHEYCQDKLFPRVLEANRHE